MEQFRQVVRSARLYQHYRKCWSRSRLAILRWRAPREFRKWAKGAHSVNVIVGAGGVRYNNWFSTDYDILDVSTSNDWQRLFKPETIDRILAEHVWEHLSEKESQKALTECYRYLKPGGRLRIAVPDGFHPNPGYLEYVRPGGKGQGSDDHKLLYDYKSLSKELKLSKFKVELLEYWDENGRFHAVEWSSDDGHIHRSRRFDPRNRNGSLSYTSLIVDGRKY
jgi:predicted SAM-dependent methyltransferase